MRKIATIILILTFNLCFSQTRLDSLILQLYQSQFYKIDRVKDSIDNYPENYQKEVIPKLIELIKDTSFIKLENWGPYSFAGSTSYKGHGLYITYYLDWISDRADWILEQITFQDFGYSEWTAAGNEMMKEYKKIYHNEINKIDTTYIYFNDSTTRAQFKKYRLFLADSVLKWWDKNKSTWTKYNALKEALSSKNFQRQYLACNYLINGKTLCEGLTIDNYNKEIKPLLKKIRRHYWTDEFGERQILKDKNYNWYKLKTI